MKLPELRFYLFGMGGRRKLLYKSGRLMDAFTGEILREWSVDNEAFFPSEYRVTLRCQNGATITIQEDEKAVWVEDGKKRDRITASPLKLPRFEQHQNPALLRRLHQEILINIVNGQPVPNLWVYPKPWYRDAAMMLLCLNHTGNLHTVKDWVGRLRDPFDRNNAGHVEPDNLGQALTMISLTADKSHPLVETILKAAPPFLNGGLSDFSEHPVYQTKWLKYGLRRLKLDDPYIIPSMEDAYSSLFWMDFKEAQAGARHFQKGDANYPYLSWAEAHFYNDPPPMPVDEGQYPLTWEANASQADYSKMVILSNAYVQHKVCVPHTWHAAEMFLYYWDRQAKGLQ